MIARSTVLAVFLTGCNTILGTSDVTGPGTGDGGVDAPTVAPGIPRLRGPSLGAATGSVHAAASLRPNLAWYPTVGATHYALQIDDTCVVASFRTCLFPSPEVDVAGLTNSSHALTADLPVALTPPVGRRYYWRVRACNDVGCGDWSEPWYLDVGRLADDVNGDGYGDVVVGIKSGTAEAATVGRATIILGQGGIGLPTVITVRDPRAEVDAHFGSAVAMVGDLNADGFGDIAVGAWNSPHASHLGWVYVYTGRGVWAPDVGAESGGYGLAQPDAAENYGARIAGSGDVNGDGYADFAATAFAPVGATRPGSVYINYGRPTAPAAQLGSDRIIPDPSGSQTDMFGSSLTLGDLNEDGYQDVLVGAAGRDSFTGGAAIYIGGKDVAAPPIVVTTADVSFVSGATPPAALGAAATICVVGGQPPVTALGAPSESAPGQAAGRVRLYRARDPWPAEVTAHDAAIDDPSGAFRASFGASLACSDVTADGRADLVASAPTPDDDGVVFVFGDVDTLPTAPTTTLSAGTGIVGHRVKVTDFNGDGIGDVIASRLRGPATPEGAVLVWFGRQAWPAAITSPDLTIPNPSGVAAERFGEALD